MSCHYWCDAVYYITKQFHHPDQGHISTSQLPPTEHSVNVISHIQHRQLYTEAVV